MRLYIRTSLQIIISIRLEPYVRILIDSKEFYLHTHVCTYYIRIIFTYVHKLQMKMFYSFVRLLKNYFSKQSLKRFLSSKWNFCFIYTYVHICVLIIYIVRDLLRTSAVQMYVPGRIFSHTFFHGLPWNLRDHRIHQRLRNRRTRNKD